MAFLTCIGIGIIIYYLIYLVLLSVVDCDIALAVAEIFGKKLNKLKGKIIWITEASCGMGESMAYEIAFNNGKMILSGTDGDKLERVKAKCLEMSPTLTNDDIMILPMDITNTDTHKGCFNSAIRHFGSVDVLITCGGKCQRSVWEDITSETDKDLFELNVFGVISLTRIAVHYFTAKGKGHIVVTSSLAGVVGLPFSSTYTASLHAIHGYFQSLRNEKLGTALQITLLCPDPVACDFLHEPSICNAGRRYKGMIDRNRRRMSAERCARLSLIAVANKLDEAWMAPPPIIPLAYALTHFPNLVKRMAKMIRPKQFRWVKNPELVR